MYSYREVVSFRIASGASARAQLCLGAMHATYTARKNARSVAEIGIKAGAEFDKSSSLPLRVFSFRTRSSAAPKYDRDAMSAIEVQVPDIGDFTDVEVIEVLVKPGDTIAKEQSLITVESDKASMEIPSSAAGVVKELRVKLGDKVSKGSAVLSLEASAPAAETTASAQAPATPASSPAVSAAPSARLPATTASPISNAMSSCSAPARWIFHCVRSADLGKKTCWASATQRSGGVCLNVGCIPSKALLHVAAVLDEASHFASIGVDFGKPSLDLDKLRAYKSKVVSKLTGGLNTMAKARKVTVLRGVGTFIGPHRLQVDITTGDGRDPSGEKKVVRFAKAIIAAGSQSCEASVHS